MWENSLGGFVGEWFAERRSPTKMEKITIIGANFPFYLNENFIE